MIFSIIGQLVCGWLLADLVTGIFHWWEDNFGREEWPIIGPWLIVPNRLHHADPLAFTHGGFMARNRASIIAAAMSGLLLAWMLSPQAWMLSLLVGAAISNEIHRYAHQPSACGRFIRMLQQTGAWQSGKAHAAHHRPPHDRNYCVMTDWLNPLLEMASLWTALELIFRKRRVA